MTKLPVKGMSMRKVNGQALTKVVDDENHYGCTELYEW